MTRAAVQTRGRAREAGYAFLGEAPERPWWRAYHGHTSFEVPTLLVQSGEQGWDIYLSGVPSIRRDAVGSTIRFTLVLAGRPEDADAALALVTAWLSDLGANGAVLAAALDEAFPEAQVERLLGALGPEGREEAQRHLLDAVASLTAAPAAAAVSEASEASDADAPPDWLADLTDPQARSAFLARASDVLNGGSGRALLLNLVGAPADVTALLEDPRPLAVLGVDLDEPTGFTELTRIGVPPGKASPPRPRPAGRGRATGRRISSLHAALMPVALVVATVLAVLGILLWQR